MRDDETLSAQVLFREAAALVQRGVAQLNMRHEMCRTCKAVHYESRRDAGIFRQLEGTPYKLRKAADFLDGLLPPVGKPHDKRPAALVPPKEEESAW